MYPLVRGILVKRERKFARGDYTRVPVFNHGYTRHHFFLAKVTQVRGHKIRIEYLVHSIHVEWVSEFSSTQALCKYCMMRGSQHGKGEKCLFSSTHFEFALETTNE